jgi:hypothetical protein
MGVASWVLRRRGDDVGRCEGEGAVGCGGRKERPNSIHSSILNSDLEVGFSSAP